MTSWIIHTLFKTFTSNYRPLSSLNPEDIETIIYWFTWLFLSFYCWCLRKKKAQNSSQSFPILLQFDWGHILWLCSLTFIYLFCDSTLILLWKIYLSPVSTIVGGLSVNVPCFPLNKWWEYAESNIPLEWEFWESFKEGKWLECRFCEIVYISFCLS